MDKKDLFKKISKESENNVPDVYDKILFAAHAEGLFDNYDNAEVYSDGETVALGGVNRKAIAITTLASVAAVCLAIALPIALSGKHEGGLSIPPVGNYDNKVVADIDLGDSYAYGAVTTARLAESFLNKPTSGANAMAKRASVSVDDFDEFGAYFSALDCFLGDEFGLSNQTPPDKYAKSIVISGERVSGDKFIYGMYYTEYKILSEDYVEGGPVDYYLEGVIQIMGIGMTSIIGERTLASNAEGAEETALKLYAYPDLEDKCTYALMELGSEDIDGTEIRSYTYRMVTGGETLSEAVAYKPTGDELVIDIKDDEEGDGVFGVTGRTEEGYFDVNYKIGENRGNFTIKSTSDGLEYFLVKDGLFTYKENGDGTCSITGYDKNQTLPDSLVIPSTYNGLPVVSIGNSAFYGIRVKTVIISEGIREIGNSAFNGSSLQTLLFPSTLTTINFMAFDGCNQLSEINLPENLTSIGAKAFDGCTNIVDLTIPSKVQRIDSYAFYECTKLTSVKLPASVGYIGTGAFSGSYCLASLTVDANNNTYHSVDNCIINTESKVLVTGCKNSIIPVDGSVTEIGAYAFSGELLSNINLPNTITKISECAFYRNYFESVTLPEGLVEIGYSAFLSNEYLKEINLPSTLEKIAGDAFQYCTSLESVNIPEKVTDFSASTFMECTGLIRLTVDANNPVFHSDGNCIIETASKTLVLGCKTSVIPDDGSVEVIGPYAFFHCELGYVTLPDCIKQIGTDAFAVSSLTGITFSKDLTIIDVSAFNACDNLTRIELPRGLIAIYRGAFSGCMNLEEVVLPSTLKVYDIEVFEDCRSLKSLVFTSGLKSINNKTCKNCIVLESVIIPKTVTVIEFQAFYGCTNLKEINFTGTVAEWEAIQKDGETWNWDTGDYVVKCTDGTLAKDGTVIN